MTTLERAVALGVDAVKVLMPWDVAPHERAARSALVGEVIAAADPLGMPVMVEPIVLRSPRGADAIAIEGDGCRMAAELGADIIKVMYPDDPELLAAWCHELEVPVVILGGPASARVRRTLRDGQRLRGSRRARDHDRPARLATTSRRGGRGARSAIGDRPRRDGGMIWQRRCRERSSDGPPRIDRELAGAARAPRLGAYPRGAPAQILPGKPRPVRALPRTRRRRAGAADGLPAGAPTSAADAHRDAGRALLRARRVARHPRVRRDRRPRP